MESQSICVELERPAGVFRILVARVWIPPESPRVCAARMVCEEVLCVCREGVALHLVEGIGRGVVAMRQARLHLYAPLCRRGGAAVGSPDHELSAPVTYRGEALAA